MRATEKYLQKITPIIRESVSDNLGIVITIPAFNEAETIRSIDALLACRKPDCDVEILVNVNYSEEAPESSKVFNETAHQILNKYAEQVSTKSVKVYVLKNANLNHKKAGVGLARKQLMDEAFYRLSSIGNLQGVITGFDADATCKDDYLVKLFQFFNQVKKAKACSIRFEHAIEGTKYDTNIYRAIALYELHLRYFIYAQKLMGSPYAYQTVGSSFAVRAEAYAQVNGMSPNKAGEDFYFLQGIMALGNFYQLNTTCIFPSSRMSNRVGFGTGPSVTEISSSGIKKTFCYKTFKEIQKLFDYLPTYYEKGNFEGLDIHPEFLSYLQNEKIEEVAQKFKQNFRDYNRFRKAFLQWFNGFRILKTVNRLSNTDDFMQIDVCEAVKDLPCIKAESGFREDLKTLREIDALESYYTL